MARDESRPDEDHYTFRLSLLPPNSKAAILSGDSTVKRSVLDSALEKISQLTFDKVESFGNAWAEMVLPESIREALPSYDDRHLVVVHDATSILEDLERMK